MVSGKVAMEQHPMGRTANLVASAEAFTLTIVGYKTQLYKTILFYPDEKYRVHVFVPTGSPAGQVLLRQGSIYKKISRAFDTLEQAKEVYDYVTSNIKYEDIASFAQWRNAVSAFNIGGEIDLV
jgi:hypothetical protein